MVGVRRQEPMKDLSELEFKVLEIDEILRPIATRPVDMRNPNWMTLLSQRLHPLDEAGVRSATERLLESLVEEYLDSDDDTRRAIRGLFTSYKHFAWAATVRVPETTDEGFRRQFVLFSMRDQGLDSRDALLALQELCKRARAAGVGTAAILQEVAQISNDENKYGMGSTKNMLQGA